MTISPDTKKYAALAADDLEKNGWLRGELADQEKEYDEKTRDYKPTLGFDACPKCALGALGYAYFGDPYEGQSGWKKDAGYRQILSEIADYIKPDWEAYYTEHEPDALRFTGVSKPIYDYNDEIADSAKEVVGKLREIAAS